MAKKRVRVPLKLGPKKVKGSSSNGGSKQSVRRRPGTKPCQGANCLKWCFGKYCSTCGPRYDFWANTTAAHRTQRGMNLERSSHFLAVARRKHGER